MSKKDKLSKKQVRSKLEVIYWLLMFFFYDQKIKAGCKLSNSVYTFRSLEFNKVVSMLVTSTEESNGIQRE